MEYTIVRDGCWEQTIQKSRFICTLRKVASEEAAQEFVKELKKQYWDATHNCSAYVVDAAHMRSSDDGEPSGTAGIPMLEVLKRQQLVGVAAVVTRYFGGVKLGTGGLVRAYGGTVAGALSAVGLARRVLLGTYGFDVALADSGRVANVLYQQSRYPLVDTDYGDKATFYLRLPASEKAAADAWLTDTFQRKIELELLAEEYAEVPVDAD